MVIVQNVKIRMHVTRLQTRDWVRYIQVMTRLSGLVTQGTRWSILGDKLTSFNLTVLFFSASLNLKLRRLDCGYQLERRLLMTNEWSCSVAEDIEYEYEEDDYLTDNDGMPFPAYEEDGIIPYYSLLFPIHYGWFPGRAVNK